jgi:LysR family glycine cleavage system transcriptional activator
MYWIVCPKATSALPKITLFREWLLAEADDDMRRLKALNSGRTQRRAVVVSRP